MKLTEKPGINIAHALIYFEMGVLGAVFGAIILQLTKTTPPKYITHCYSRVDYSVLEDGDNTTITETRLPAMDYCETTKENR